MGNAGAQSHDVAWQVDLSILDTTITEAPPAVSGTSATFSFTSTRSGTFQCKLEPGESTFSDCVTPKSYTLLSDATNPHTFSVRAIDGAQNVDDTPATYHWMVDSTPPSPSITSPSGTTGARPQLAFSTEAGASYSCHFDSQPAFACSSGVIAPTLAEGAHVFFVGGTDAVGNVGANVSQGFTVDTTGPTFDSFTGPLEHHHRSQRDVHVHHLRWQPDMHDRWGDASRRLRVPGSARSALRGKSHLRRDGTRCGWQSYVDHPHVERRAARLRWATSRSGPRTIEFHDE